MSVIDVGAGASRLVDALLERGHRDVSVLDVSEQGLAVVRARLGAAAEQARWIVTDLLGWQPDRRFDVWHDRAVFHFLTDPRDQARYVAALDAAVADHGVLVIGTVADDAPQACSGLPTSRYSPEQLLAALGGPARWAELGRRRELHITRPGWNRCSPGWRCADVPRARRDTPMAWLCTSGNRARHWHDVYAHRAETEFSWFEPEPRCSLEMLDALGVHPDDPVIDVGTGASRLIDALLQRGFGDVAALDISRMGPSRTRDRVGTAAEHVDWVIDDLLRWVPRRRYAAWHDRGLFHFLTGPADRRRYLELLDVALVPGGAVVVGAFAQDGPRTCAGLRTARYSPDRLARTITRDPTTDTIALAREMHATPTGMLQPFTWIAARHW